MKNPFAVMLRPSEPDTAGELARTREDLAEMTPRMAALDQERQAAIEGGGNLADAVVIDHKIVDAVYLREAIVDRIAALELRLVEERKNRRERWRTAGLAILDVAAEHLATMRPPIYVTPYMERARDGVVDFAFDMLEKSGRRVADRNAGKDFLERCVRHYHKLTDYPPIELPKFAEVVASVGLDAVYGPDGDYEDQTAEAEAA